KRPENLQGVDGQLGEKTQQLRIGWVWKPTTNLRPAPPPLKWWFRKSALVRSERRLTGLVSPPLR
ncbi:MAG: hypothetical protein U0Q18_34170, partial [Bryobacteraceae bacterium]